MRFHWGAVPKSPDFTPDEAWKPLKEFSPWLAQLASLPIGLAAAAGVVVLWFTITPLKAAALIFSMPDFLVASIGFVIVHELIHAAAHPLAGRSSRSLLGIWPSRLIAYAYYDGELTRNRLVTILLMPFLVITFAPLLFSVITRSVSVWVAFVSVLNALGSSVDILFAAMLLVQVPPAGVVRNQGWWSYWRVTPAAGGP